MVELFGKYFETTHHLPPLGSRILATLIIDTCEDKVSFEDLVERMGASKSSVSTNLNLLLKLGKLTYYTLPGDRKKYYRPTKFSDRFNNYLKMMEVEKEIIDKMYAYREKSMACPKEKLDLEMLKLYKSHVVTMESLLTKTINEFKELEKQYPL